MKMDDSALDVTKAITKLFETREKRHSDQQKLLLQLQSKVDALEKLCTNLTDENSKLRDNLTQCKKQGDSLETKCTNLANDNGKLREELTMWRKQEDASREGIKGKLEGYMEVTTTVARQLNEMKDHNDLVNDRISQLTEHIKRHQKHLTNISSYVRQPPAAHYSPRVNSIPRSMSSRFSHAEQNSPLPESIDDDELSVLSEHAEHLKRGVDALNELHQSFEKNLYYDH